MTFKEKLQKERPEIAYKYFGCPKHLGYEDENIYCHQMHCFDCWNREIPITEDNTTKNLSKEFNTFVCDKCLIKIEDFVKVEILLGLYGVEYEDTKDYKFKFCPECGRKVVE